MSVSTTNVFNQYVSGGGATFTVTFYVRSSTWLEVKVDDVVSGAWNATLNTDQSGAPGGTITFTGSPPGAGAIIRINRVTPVVQPDVYAPFGPFPAQTVEYDFDRAVCIMQEIDYALSLITLPSPVGHAGEFLGSDGANFIWADVLPTPYVPGFFLAASSTTTLVWAAGGGGGGGPGIMGPLLPDAGADGAQFTGVSGNVLQLGIADEANPGVVDNAIQPFTGLKNFRDGASTSIYDPRLRGAVALLNNIDPTLAVDDFGPKFYDTVTSWSKTLGTSLVGFPTQFGVGTIELPEGAFFTSMPLCVPGQAHIQGKGWLNTFIAPGPGNAGTPSQVQGFSGPLFYCTTPYLGSPGASTNFPVYQSALVTGPGQAIVIDPTFFFGVRNNNQWMLHDAFDWIKFGLQRELAFSLQCFFQPQSGPAIAPNYEGAILGSMGPNNVWTNFGDHTDRAYGFALVSNDGVNIQFKAYLTTNPLWASPFEMQATGTLHSITSSNVTFGSTYNLEISYDGSFFNFYVNGVIQGHVGATGPIVQAAWEGVHIGTNGPEFCDGSGDIGLLSCKGAVYSLRLSNVARHTGSGSFTNPTTAYTWDSNTCALYNFDQGDKTYQPLDYDGNPAGTFITLPFVVGQARANGVGPLPHYIRVNGSSLCQGAIIKDLFLNCGWMTTGITTAAAPESLFERIYVNNPTMFGIRIGTAVSFYANIQDCRVNQAIGTGFQYIGDGYRLQTQSCGIGIQIQSGNLWSGNNQPTYTGWACMVIGPGASQAQISVKSSTVDNEFWHFRRTRSPTIVYGNAVTTLEFENNGFSAVLTEGPPILFAGPFPSNNVTSSGDLYLPNQAGAVPNLDGSPAAVAIKYSNSYPGKFLLTDPKIIDPQGLRLSNITGFVSIIEPGQQTAWTGISLTDVKANNLAGTFTIRAAFTEGGPIFVTPELDADYQVTITAKSALGGTPAADSTNIVGYTTRTDGFTVTTAAAPGGSVEITFGYQLTRVFSQAPLFEYTPAIPSSFPNPMAGSVASQSAWYVGLVLVPNTGNLIAYDQDLAATQTIVESGDTPSVNWWKLNLGSAVGSWDFEMGVTAFQQFACVARGGKLSSIHSPGAHFLAVGQEGNRVYYNIDGIAQIAGPAITGAQGDNIFVGELFDTTLPLTLATVRNLKFGPIVEQVLSFDNDVGPGSQNQALILGDEVSYGAISIAGDGGYAGQIQTAKYGTTFYHSGTMLNGGWMDSLISNGVPGLSTDVWAPFQGLFTSAPQLECLIMFAGIHDILNSKLATDIFAAMVGVVEGQFASATWEPSTSFTTPSDQRAFAVLTGARSAGTTNYVIDGTPIANTRNVDDFQTNTDLAAAIVADGTLGPVWTPVLQNNPVGSSSWGTILYHKVPGTVGNGKLFTCDGLAGGFLYGDVGDGVPSTGLSVRSFNGLDSGIVLNNVTFVSNFDTDAATTVNHMVSIINASAPTNTLVTAANVANKCVITTNTRGVAGSEIPIVGKNFNFSQITGYSAFSPPGVLQGGEDGAITKGIGTILICNVQPFKGAVGYTVPRDTQRIALNALINAYAPDPSVTIVDVESTLWDPGDHLQIDPTLGAGWTPFAAGHAALYTLISALIP